MSFKFFYKKDYKNKGWVLYFDKHVVYGKNREKCLEKLNKILDNKIFL